VRAYIKTTDAVPLADRVDLEPEDKIARVLSLALQSKRLKLDKNSAHCIFYNGNPVSENLTVRELSGGILINSPDPIVFLVINMKDTSAKSNLLIESLKNDLQLKTDERDIESRKVEKLQDMIRDQHKDNAEIGDYDEKYKEAKKQIKEMTKHNKELNEKIKIQRIQIQTLEADLVHDDATARFVRAIERSYNDKLNQIESKMKDKDIIIKNLTAQNNQSFYNLDRNQHDIHRRDEQIANLSAFIDKYISNDDNNADGSEETSKKYFRDCLQRIKTGLTIGPTVTSGECDICYSPLANLPTETWKCKHVFCSVCSRQWRDKSPGGPTCPTCRLSEPIAREYPKFRR